MHRFVFVVSAFTAIVVSSVAFADPSAPQAVPVAVPRESVASELAALQAQVPLWKARAEIARYKAEARKAESDGVAVAVPLGATLPGPGTASSPRASETPRAAAGAPVALVSIRGDGARLSAVLSTGAHLVEKRVGDTLEGGWSVAAIDTSSVILRRGKQTMVLKG